MITQKINMGNKTKDQMESDIEIFKLYVIHLAINNNI
jgi:hypothetical protein